MSKNVSLVFLGIFLLFSTALACQTTGPTSETVPETSKEAGKETAVESTSEPTSESVAEANPPDAGSEATQPEKQIVESNPQPDASQPKTTFGGTRPAILKLPKNYDPNNTYPLVVVLHGYGATGSIQAFYLGMDGLVDKAGFLMIAPDGLKDTTGKQFWNATEACCDFGGNGVDDVAYLRGLIEEIKKAHKIDPKRVFLLGHSNGGFMSYRMACEVSDQIAGIVSLAGATFADASKCAPTQPVHILQIHGNKDSTILYDGGKNITFAYPSAKDSVTMWGKYNKCQGTLEATQATYDLESVLPSAETDEMLVGSCPEGGKVGLWTIKEGSHIPALSENFASEVWKWMQAHPKP